MSLRSRIATVATCLVLAAIAVNTLLQTIAAIQAVRGQARADAEAIAELLARSASFAIDVPQEVENEIGLQMRAQASLVAHLVAIADKAGVAQSDVLEALRAVKSDTGIDFLATDSEGRIRLHTDDSVGDFVFSPDPAVQPQAHIFHKLLGGDVPVVVQEARKREVDSRVFKYVGVGGVDRPRIVQVGMEATFLDRLDRNLGLRRLVSEVVQGEVREVRILDAALNPLVEQRAAGSDPAATDRADAAAADLDMVRKCIDEDNAIGRLEGTGYRCAAPVRRPDGRPAGAVLVELSTASSRRVLWWQAAAAAVSSLLVGVPGVIASLWIARSVAGPVRQAMHVAERIASGDLASPVPEGDEHEVGRLLSAMRTMSERLASLIGRIQTAGDRLAAVEGRTAQALSRQDRAIRDFGESATEIATAVNEISATSEQLLGATSDVTRVAREAADVADAGRGGLESMASSMQQLDEAMNAFTRKLSTISQRASGITSVVTAIAKVADQTNLLSVNATIEAEKAGESGRGFRIVAQEIRRLADQTALATKDIERMVRDMQAAVSSGTMEMDRFRNEVASRIAEVAGVSEQLGHIIEPVQSVTESLEHVHEGMKSQSQGARQISSAMEGLREGAGASADSLGVFASSLDELRQAIGDLNREASQFHVAG